MTPAEKAELLAVLCAHAKKYPLSEPRDAVKLLFQNAFGGEHLITNEAAFRAYLSDELARTAEIPGLSPTEDIGNGIVRLQLASPAARSLGEEKITEIFLRSAKEHKRDEDAFAEKIAFLKENLEKTGYAFSQSALSEFLKIYSEAGCPPVTHSDAYRSAYRPAYRVMKRAFLPENL